ncbi:MAG: hypothetical protein WAU36_11650 [Cyclobacteriaceae bacterium]
MTSVKYAKFMSTVGAITIMVWAVLKIVHFEFENHYQLLLLGSILTTVGQSWEIKLLKQRIKE